MGVLLSRSSQGSSGTRQRRCKDMRGWLGLGGGVGSGRLEFCWALGFRVQSLEVSGIGV